MEEKRIFERVTAPLKIKYEIIEKIPSLKKATSENISGGGIELALKEELAIGINLKLDIEIPGQGNRATTAYGKVVRSRKVEISGKKASTYYETGIVFTKADPLSLGRIFKYFSEKNK